MATGVTEPRRGRRRGGYRLVVLPGVRLNVAPDDARLLGHLHVADAREAGVDERALPEVRRGRVLALGRLRKGG